VSRSWRSIAMDGSLWKVIDTTRFYKIIKDDQLRVLGTAASNFLRYANFRGCVQLSGDSLRAIAEHCPNVERLDLTGCRSVSSKSIADVCMNMPLLLHLELAGLQSVNNYTLQAMAVYCRSLQVLNLAWCKQISGFGLSNLTRSCQDLRKLNVSGCSGLEDRWMPVMGMNLPRLREICLNGCGSLTDRGLIGLLSGLSARLDYLGLSHCRLLTTEALRAIGHYCNRHLRRLELSGCESLGDEGLIILAQNCTRLRLLDLEDVNLLTDASLRAFGMYLPKLERLSLSYCENVTDQGIIRIAASLCCKRLVHLELDNCLLITDRLLLEFANVIRQKKRKSSLNLLRSASTPSAYASRPVRPTLQIFDCRNITLEGVEAAQLRCPSLAVKSYYSWSNPSTSVPAASTLGFGGSGGSLEEAFEGELEGDEEEDDDEDADADDENGSGVAGRRHGSRRGTSSIGGNAGLLHGHGGGGGGSSSGSANSSQTSLHHLHVQQQHLQLLQLQRLNRPANLLQRARLGLLGSHGHGGHGHGHAGHRDSQCTIL
ncbi:hypothetical protein BKA57DRAFT_394232, partial [Linnemannia elongata]